MPSTCLFNIDLFAFLQFSRIYSHKLKTQFWSANATTSFASSICAFQSFRSCLVMVTLTKDIFSLTSFNCSLFKLNLRRIQVIFSPSFCILFRCFSISLFYWLQESLCSLSVHIRHLSFSYKKFWMKFSLAKLILCHNVCSCISNFVKDRF